jgi:hypothetical protein
MLQLRVSKLRCVVQVTVMKWYKGVAAMHIPCSSVPTVRHRDKAKPQTSLCSSVETGRIGRGENDSGVKAVETQCFVVCHYGSGDWWG